MNTLLYCKNSYHNLADTLSSTTPIAPRCLHTLYRVRSLRVTIPTT